MIRIGLKVLNKMAKRMLIECADLIECANGELTFIFDKLSHKERYWSAWLIGLGSNVLIKFDSASQDSNA